MNSVVTLIPKPQSMILTGQNVLVSKGSKSRILFEYEPINSPIYMNAVEVIKSSLVDAGCLVPGDQSYLITFRIDPNSEVFKDNKTADSYYIKVGEKSSEIIAYDQGGALCAANSFGQLLQTDNERVYLPEVEILDWPSFAFRSLFIEDRYGSDFLTKEDWMKAIDYFSSMKYNNLTVGIYGCWCQQYDGMISEFLYVPFEKWPEMQTPRHVKYFSVSERKWIYKENILPTMFKEDYLLDLIAYAKDRNITVKPLFNSYGHNTLIPRVFPELSAKDEEGQDTGFGVCTSDQRTYDILFDLYDTIIEKYLNPNGIDAIHLGMDEVWDGIGMDYKDPFKYHTPFCQCSACSGKERGELMGDYIIKLSKHLKEKGIRHVHIYYDMLFNNFDMLNDDFVEKLKKQDVYDVVVIDWWHYSGEDNLFYGKKLNALFRSIIKSITGYYHWSTPVEYLSNIRGCARIAKELAYEGLEAYSSLEYSHDRSYLYHAELSWNISTLEDQDDFLRRYAEYRFPDSSENARLVLQDLGELMNDNFMGGKTTPCELFKLDYYMYTYVKKEKPYPRLFPEEAFERIHGDLDYFVSYFEKVQSKSQRALEFFEQQFMHGSSESFIDLTWLAIAKHFRVVASEYLGLLDLEGEREAKSALSRLDTLIQDREDLMRTVEFARIEGNQYMYLRNMSIYRQILLDIRDYALRCLENLEPFVLNMRDLTGITGDMLRFLR